MTHSYTLKGQIRYRYYVCQQAMKRGWRECETRSVPAQEIEDFVIQQIKAIGHDPELAAEVVVRAREDRQRQEDALRAEKAELERSLREKARGIAGLFDLPNASARLAESEAQIRAGESRLSQIPLEIAALGPIEIDEEDVSNALGRFDEIAKALAPIEKERLIQLLVERVTYDGKKSSVAITFRPSGIKSLNLEQP
jgi:site-specific DNA recombinase